MSASPDPFNARATLSVGGTDYAIWRLGALGTDLSRTPYVVKILIENVLRNAGGEDSPASSHRIQSDRHGAWLETHGTQVTITGKGLKPEDEQKADPEKPDAKSKRKATEAELFSDKAMATPEGVTKALAHMRAIARKHLAAALGGLAALLAAAAVPAGVRNLVVDQLHGPRVLALDAHTHCGEHLAYRAREADSSQLPGHVREHVELAVRHVEVPGHPRQHPDVARQQPRVGHHVEVPGPVPRRGGHTAAHMRSRTVQRGASQHNRHIGRVSVMFRTRRRFAPFAAALTVLSLFSAVPGSARADSAADQKKKIAQLAAELNSLNDRIAVLDEQYGAALDKKDQLDKKIAASQTQLAQQQGELDKLQGSLGQIAVNRFVGNNTHDLSALFASAAVYSQAEQMNALSSIAFDTGSGTADDLPPSLQFMQLTRATNQPGPDGVLGTADDIKDVKNLVTPYIDNNQTYTSHPSHQVFLREYRLNAAGKPVSTGRLLEGPNGAIGNWDDVKAQARTLLGIALNDFDVLNVPLLLTDAYGRFLPGPNGYPQLVTATGLVEGDPANPVSPQAVGALSAGRAFLDDIAHHAAPGTWDNDNNPATPPVRQVPDADPGTTDDGLPGTYDDEMLGKHFICGDGRCNENIGLTTIHQIFHTEHNGLVKQLEDFIPTLPGTSLAALPVWKLPDGSWNGDRRSEERRVGKECRSRWSPYH